MNNLDPNDIEGNIDKGAHAIGVELVALNQYITDLSNLPDHLLDTTGNHMTAITFTKKDFKKLEADLTRHMVRTGKLIHLLATVSERQKMAIKTSKSFAKRKHINEVVDQRIAQKTDPNPKVGA